MYFCIMVSVDDPHGASTDGQAVSIGRASLACENEAGGSWGQEVHILHVNI